MNSRRPTRIALLGTRGIPARYGGFETFAEELSGRLAERGHSVVVYGRRGLFDRRRPERARENLECRFAPTIYHKYLETPLAAFTSFLSVLALDVDVILLCNAANSPFSWLARLKRIPVVTNVDGIERRRSKWNSFGKFWYLLGERSAVLFSRSVVADAHSIASYYWRAFGLKTESIAYGATPEPAQGSDVLEKYSLKKGGYVLYVSRLEPENNALGVIQAFTRTEVQIPLVIVGDAPYSTEYKQLLRAAADERVIFTGYQFGDAYRQLRSNCYVYVQATEVGGTHPALVEAMAYGNCIVANGVPEHYEVLGGCGEYYQRNDFDDLSVKLEALLEQPEKIKQFGEAARSRAEERYSWKEITDRYESLLLEIVEEKHRRL